MAWFYLFIAGLCEILWAVKLKDTNGFTRLTPSIVTIVAMLVSFWLLSLAMRDLPMGTSYAVWTGIGVIGTALFGMIWLNEPRDAVRVACIALIILGIVGLKWSTPAGSPVASAS